MIQGIIMLNSTIQAMINHKQQYYTSGKARAANIESYTHKLRAKIKELEKQLKFAKEESNMYFLKWVSVKLNIKEDLNEQT